jgi:formylglycine-generating enzyme required for sulfatase activity
MKRALTLLILLFLLPGVTLAERGIKVRENLENNSGENIGIYRALVIGINDYKDSKIPDLKTAVNDARSVADLLKTIYGFTDLTLLVNSQADGSSIQKALRRLATKSKKDDSVLIYYAGHGDLDKITKDGWWIPYNAKASDPFTYIGNTVIQNIVKAIPARHVLVVSDSCFSGTLFGDARNLPSVIDDKYYATLFKEKSRWGMTSGNLTPVTDQGAEGHSLFAYQFIKSLRDNQKPYLTPREIYQRIAPIISNNSEQMPITKPIKNTDDRGGEFIFIRDIVSQPEKPKPVPGIDAEETLWKAIENSSYIEDFQDYLNTYPKGRFTVTAKIKIRQLNRKKKPNTVAGGSVQTEDIGDGTVNISSQPTGTKIYINNEYKGTTPFSLLLKQGNYTIRVEIEGYKSESKRIVVNSSKRTQLSFILDKQGGSLFVRSNPASAKVYLNNQYQGESPLTWKGLDAGSYSLSLKIEGYSDYRQTVVIKQGRESQIIARLERVKPSVSVLQNMVLIPAGEFEMGSNSGNGNEIPIHSVSLGQYYIDRYEVTVAQYKKCYNSGKCKQPLTGGTFNWGTSDRNNHPVNGVSWNDAKAYCEYAGKRLPTEAEWEKAATFKNGRKYKYPSGKSDISCADAIMVNGYYTFRDWKTKGGCGRVSTWSVGSKPEEINGTFDMAGNVWEWVSDWNGSYSSGYQRNPTGPSSGSHRVSRGGS